MRIFIKSAHQNNSNIFESKQSQNW